MFKLDVTRLQRSGPQKLEGTIGADDEVWLQLDAQPGEPVKVELRATMTPTGQVIVPGGMEGSYRHECRRCLEEVRRGFREEVDLVWTVPDELEDPVDGGELRPLDPGATEIDVGEALREELLLRIPRWVLCREGCSGLCPHCGINRNLETCDCSPKEADPRWDALRGLKIDERT
jgi:uncharacterized protein